MELGMDLRNAQQPQLVVPAGTWFAAEVPEGFALTGCTVAPGFEFEDFELGKQTNLVRLFPDHESVITRLTRI